MKIKKIIFFVLLSFICVEKGNTEINDALFMTVGNKPITKSDVVNEIKIILILSNESYKGVKITLEDNNMELTSNNPDLGDAQDNLEIEYNGERLEMGFNARYFIDILQAMESDVVEAGFIDNSSPCLITGDDDKGFLGLIMPMRL